MQPLPRDLKCPKLMAVVMDCKMALVEGKISDPISVSVVDFYTGEILLNSLIKPRKPVIQWNTWLHGISLGTMRKAVTKREALDGWESAREEFLRLIDVDTVVISQSLHHDLQVMRLAHAKIVDTAILTAEAVFGKSYKFGRRYNLRLLSYDLPGLLIRQGSEHHDVLEDTMATREIPLWCLRNPVELGRWAAIAAIAAIEICPRA